MMKAAESTVPNATIQMQARWAFFDKRFQPKIQMPRKVDSKKKAPRPSKASGPPNTLPDELRVGGPVHAELELLNEPRHHADGDVDEQQRSRRSGPGAGTSRRRCGTSAVCSRATRKARPMVTGTKRKW